MSFRVSKFKNCNSEALIVDTMWLNLVAKPRLIVMSQKIQIDIRSLVNGMTYRNTDSEDVKILDCCSIVPIPGFAASTSVDYCK
jgi:hypothetical protein